MGGHTDNQVFVCDIKENDDVRFFRSLHNNVDFYPIDATSEDQLHALIDNQLKDVCFDLLITTVGTTTDLTSVVDYEAFKHVFELNFYGNVIPIITLLKNKRLNRKSRIVVLTSTSAHHAHKAMTPYAPSKWALENFCDSLRSEFWGKIGVDTICPGNIRNERSESFKSENGIDAALVAYEIEKITKSNEVGSCHYSPGKKRVLHIAERVMPETLDCAYHLKNAASRKKIYSNQDHSVALITGASSGLGYELALKVSSRVKKLIVVARRGERLNDLQKKIQSVAPKCNVVPIIADLGKEKDLKIVCETAVKEKVNILVNNVGMQIRSNIRDMDIYTLKRSFAVNVWSHIYLTSKLLKHNDLNQVVDIISTTGVVGRRELSSYSSAKAAMWCFTREMRRQYGNKISILEVVPATFESELGKLESTKQVHDVTPGKAGKLYKKLSSKEVASYVNQAMQSYKDRLYLPRTATCGFVIAEAVMPNIFRSHFR